MPVHYGFLLRQCHGLTAPSRAPPRARVSAQPAQLPQWMRGERSEPGYNLLLPVRVSVFPVTICAIEMAARPLKGKKHVPRWREVK